MRGSRADTGSDSGIERAGAYALRMHLPEPDQPRPPGTISRATGKLMTHWFHGSTC